jgi:hypothetical protein
VPSEIENLLVVLGSPTDEDFRILDEMIRDEVELEEILNFTDPILIGKNSPIGLNREEIELLRTARKRLKFRRWRK